MEHLGNELDLKDGSKRMRRVRDTPHVMNRGVRPALAWAASFRMTGKAADELRQM